jgi:hypothetical protein
MGKLFISSFALTFTLAAVWAAAPAHAGFYASPAVVDVYVTG